MGLRLDNPGESLTDIVSLCGKVVHDFEREPHTVNAGDLADLRDKINALRAHVSRFGYATVPGLVREDP